MFEGEIVGDPGDVAGLAAQDLDAGPWEACGIDGAEHIGDGPGRVPPAADEPDMHLAAPGKTLEFAPEGDEVTRDLE